jgi:hypothetical protein
MDSVQLHLILNHLPTTGVLIAAAIVGLGRLHGGTQYGRLALVARGRKAESLSQSRSIPRQRPVVT